VHSAHTLAKVKNERLAEGDSPEPQARVIGEEQVVAEADRLIASTSDEAEQLIDLYDAEPAVVRTIPPGVDLDTFTPGPRDAARARLGLRAAPTLLFVGRIQPLKAPDLLLRAAARLRGEHPDLQVVVVGGASGSGLDGRDWLGGMARELDLAQTVRFVPPRDRAVVADYYRAADLTVVPSYTESFGLVALESQACGTPVVAAAVGGLTTAVRDGVTGVLVDGHDPEQWAKVLGDLLRSDSDVAALGAATRAHAERFSWDRTTADLIDAYREAIDELARRSKAPA
jgi:D-inositol-3-phosphate glycosyltransferase